MRLSVGLQDINRVTQKNHRLVKQVFQSEQVNNIVV